MAHFFSFEPKRMLCPLDFSELSDLALKYAAVAAREYDVTLHILHAETFELARQAVKAQKNPPRLTTPSSKHYSKRLHPDLKSVKPAFHVIQRQPTS